MSHQPTATDLLPHPAVIAGFRRALDESHLGTGNPIEQGGFILRNPTTGGFEIVRLPSGQRDSLSYPSCPDGVYQMKEIVGTFHTHPNTGPEWRQEPSPQDIRLSREHPETMGPHQFVVAKETIYHVDNEGTVLEMGATDQLLSREQES